MLEEFERQLQDSISTYRHELSRLLEYRHVMRKMMEDKDEPMEMDGNNLAALLQDIECFAPAPKIIKFTATDQEIEEQLEAVMKTQGRMEFFLDETDGADGKYPLEIQTMGSVTSLAIMMKIYYLYGGITF